MLSLEFNFSVGEDARWGRDWKQAKLTVHVYKTSRFLKLKKQIVRGHGVAHCDPALRGQLHPPQHGELEPVHVDQLSWEWVSGDCLRLLMVCCPALPIVWNSFWELTVFHTSKAIFAFICLWFKKARSKALYQSPSDDFNPIMKINLPSTSHDFKKRNS